MAQAQPAEGTILTSFESGVFGVGVGFDGTLLYVPDDFSASTLQLFQTDGTPAGSLPLVGCTVSVISWDAGRGVFWGAEGTEIFTIDPGSGLCTPQFSVAGNLPGDCKIGGCISLVDGIDHDPGDDTLWYTPDASLRVYHFDTSGNLLGFFDVDIPPNDVAAQCGFDYSSGVATGVDPRAIYIAADGCTTVFHYDKTDGTKVGFFPVVAERNEDMECDSTTFDDQGTDAIWVKDIEGHLTAFAVAEGTCTVEPLEVEKHYSFTNVCFERDNDGDGAFGEDPIDGIDNDGDGLIDEDPVECPDGTSLGTALPMDADGNFIVEAVVTRRGTVASYNPGQYYAVSSVNVLVDLESLTILERFGECTEGDAPISALNPRMGTGGGNVVIVMVGPDGVAKQVADSNSPNVLISDENSNGVPDDAEAMLEDVPAGTTVLMYVKFGPGLKGMDLPDGELTCVNENEARLEGEEEGMIASATLKVVEK